MKKIIMILAASLMASVAMAQSSVNIYGTVDMGFAHSTADRTDGVDTKNGLGSLWSGSYIGFTGTEQLGNGLSAGFTLEYALSPNTNAGINTAREQSVNLSSTTFGTVKLGQMPTLGKMEIDKFDPMQTTSFGPLAALQGSTINTNSRAGNTMAYISPVVAGGLTLGATYSTDITMANTAYGNGTDQERVYGLMADYTAGPLSVGYVYHRVYDLARIAGLDNTEHLIGAKFQVMPNIAVLGSYQTDKNNIGTNDKDIFSIGGQFAATDKIGVDVGYAQLNDKTAANADATAWGVQTNYKFSKRTLAYAGYTHVANDNGGTAVAFGPTDGVTPLGTGGLSSSGFGVGMKHSF